MFADVVALYRLIGKPQLTGGNSVEMSLPSSTVLTQLRHKLEGISAALGDYHFENSADGSVQIDATFPASENHRIFDTVSEFIGQTPTLSNGQFRQGFYIRELDYSDSDESQPEQITRLRRAVEFIRSLRKFSELNANSGDLQSFNKLFFFLPSDKNSRQKTAIVPLILSEEFQRFDIPSFQILNQLTDPKHSDKLHMEERQLILSVSIADVAKDDSDKSLEHLARNWRLVITRYRHDLLAYVNNFAFDAERKKIADSAIEYSTKLSSTLNEVTGKLLAAPISVGALVVLYRSANGIEFWMGCLGVFIVFVLYRVLLLNQVEQINRLQSSYCFILNGFLGKKKTFPTVIQNELNKLENDAKDQAIALKRAVVTYTIVGYLPVGAIVLMTYWKYRESVHAFVFRLLG